MAWDVVNARLNTTAVAIIDRQGTVRVGRVRAVRTCASRLYRAVLRAFPPLCRRHSHAGRAPPDVLRTESRGGDRSVSGGFDPARATFAGCRESARADRFSTSLDNKATAILMKDGRQLLTLAKSGSPGPVPFGFIYEFQNFSLNDEGKVLTRALVASAPAGLLLASREGTENGRQD